MAGMNFPDAPTVGQKFPATVTAGLPQYNWDGEKWTTIGGTTTAASPATALPLQDATPAVVGVSSAYAREDHKHPTDTSRVALAGDTMTGALNINAAAPLIGLRAVGTTSPAILAAYRDGSTRWYVTMTVGPESGGNVGSDFAINRFTDTGALIDSPISISRANGRVSLLGDPTSPLHAATKNYVDVNAVAAANSKVAKAGDTMSGILSFSGSGGINMISPTTIGQAGPGPNLITGQAGQQPILSFLVSGAFGGNLGMDSAGNFYVGGWSFGATAYKVWTSRDFPNPGSPLINSRLVYIIDGNANGTGGGLVATERWPGAFVSDITFSTDASSGMVNNIGGRWRYVQMQNSAGTWFTVSTA